MRYSIVTPAFNSERFIGETIESVISQTGNFSIEYFIMDGGSSDGTREIVQRYQKILAENSYPIQCNEVVIHWHSEKDDGMYDAINKGFQNATGDIYAWINSDDLYLPGAFATIAAVFAKYPEIEWLHGISACISTRSTIYAAGTLNLYAQEWIAKGVCGRELDFIRQDSVFWRRGLWQKVGEIDRSLKVAGDYYLWIMFSKYAPLVLVKAYLSCFRIVEAQLSGNMFRYREEMSKICAPDVDLGRTIKLELIARRTIKLKKMMPGWMRSYFYRALLGKQKYRAIAISPKDDIKLYEGDYYSVWNKLL